jgi:hypothetical protein
MIYGNLRNPHISIMKCVVSYEYLSTHFDVSNSTYFQTNLRGFGWIDLPKNFLMDIDACDQLLIAFPFSIITRHNYC